MRVPRPTRHLASGSLRCSICRSLVINHQLDKNDMDAMAVLKLLHYVRQSPIFRLPSKKRCLTLVLPV
jgi:hypothetical protein